MDAQTQPDGIVVSRFRRGGQDWSCQSGVRAFIKIL